MKSSSWFWLDYRLNRLSPQQVWAGREQVNRLVVVMSDGRPLPANLSPAHIIPYHNNPARFLQEVEQRVALMTDQPELFSVVIASRYGDAYDDLEAQLRTSSLTTVFFLEGGLHAYQEFFANARLLKDVSRSTIAVACPSCQTGCQ